MSGCLEPQLLARIARGDSHKEELEEASAHLSGCESCQKALEEAREDAAAEFPTMRALTGDPTAESPARAQATLSPGAAVDRYIVLGTVGSGGMGVVYSAYDPELDRKVALKVLRAEFNRDPAGGQARLLREAQAMARIAHPNVIPVYDVGVLGDRVFLAMEFVEGDTLRNWVKRKKHGGWREVLQAFLDAGRGLAAAHAAGLVHRDFKPDNVLVGKDGRVRVMDFGLARIQEEEAPSASTRPHVPRSEASDKLRSSALTQAGEVMGTPQYMAPEQRLGFAADARSDQFSFCAALYWALYRVNPFEPQRLVAAAVEAFGDEGVSRITTDEYAKRVWSTVIREPPREVKVPARVRKVILRGLSLTPEERYESMDALLHALALDPSQRRRWYVAGAGLALVAAGVGVTVQRSVAQAQLCGGAERKLEGVWDPSRAAAIESAFLATGKSYAPATVAAVKAQLDQYTRRWAAMHREACEATRVRGEQVEQVLSLRMICLDRRLKDVRALVDLLADRDSAAVDKAVDAVHGLPSLRQCADVEALTSQTAPPEEAAAREKFDKLSALLAQAHALADAGRFKDGLAKAKEANALAGQLSYRPMQAEALETLGSLTHAAGDSRSGEQLLAEAVAAAIAARHDQALAESATRLVYVVGYAQSRFEEGLRWGLLARAAIERLGGADELEIDLRKNLGAVQLTAGHLPEAREEYERALALADKALGPEHPKRALILSALGLVYRRMGENDKARATLEESLRIIEKVLGADHPSAAYPHSSISALFVAQKDYPRALFHVQRALALFEASMGPDHPTVGNAHDSLGFILYSQSRFAEALEHYRRGLEIKEKALGAESPDVAYSSAGVANCYLAMGRPKEAVPLLERALSLKVGGAVEAAKMHFQLAQALYPTGHADRALALARQAHAEFTAAGAKDRLPEVDAWLAKPK